MDSFMNGFSPAPCNKQQQRRREENKEKHPVMELVDHIIIGSGFSGICMGIKLKNQGYDNFIILEKAKSLGGTWRDNVYPGVKCDIPHSLYSFSFDVGVGTYSTQPELLKYLQNIADKYDLGPHIRYDKNVCKARYDAVGRWTVETADGEKLQCKFLILGVGQLHHPKMPKIPGIETFQGSCLHTAQWDPSVSLFNQRVGVIGSGASGIQVTGEASKSSSEVHVFQRSANYVIPIIIGTEIENRFARLSSWANRLYRSYLTNLLEVVMFRSVRGDWLWNSIIFWVWKLYLRLSVKDPSKRKLLTPNFPFGARRTLTSNTYYQAFGMDHVTLHTNGIQRITPTGVVDNDGKETKLDILVCATGFQSSPFIPDIDIVGENGGMSLHEHWCGTGRRGSCHAYYGLMTHGFPNLFFLYGPNTNISHLSSVEMIEAQTRFFMKMFSYLDEQGQVRTGGNDDETEEKMASATSSHDTGISSPLPSSSSSTSKKFLSGSIAVVSVKQEVEESFVEDHDKKIINETNFAKVSDSWYIENGRVSRNWYGSVTMYKRALESISLKDDFIFRSSSS